MITLEADPHHAEVDRANIAHAGLADIVEVRIGPALDTLPQLDKERCGPFDSIFIDAASTDANGQGARRFNEMPATEPRVSATEIQTVGCKGYDGFNWPSSLRMPADIESVSYSTPVHLSNLRRGRARLVSSEEQQSILARSYTGLHNAKVNAKTAYRQT